MDYLGKTFLNISNSSWLSLKFPQGRHSSLGSSGLEVDTGEFLACILPWTRVWGISVKSSGKLMISVPAVEEETLVDIRVYTPRAGVQASAAAQLARSLE